MAQEMNENTFEIQNHEQLFFELDFGRYEEQNFDFQLSEAEQQADKITIEFEEEWKQMSDQYQDSSDPLNQRGQYDISQFEPKIFGYSTKEIPSFAKILLILAVFTSFGGIIYYATLHLGQEKTITSKHQQKKQKKSQ
ncbi:hypothetical protein PPERSA_07468 [Pseudocohnilembus persalinus]|uniref:Transmembrane protein n=1 Tax=Pseudocohnilembus persalinus TaxID=266149 RepID=A0A0V0R2Z3_PSEPJ|nr:hypothetical protein PPERSA_07468 [Pseudocohnilembus persalinus]|eukprot:KRX08656.1 hypothetical protein PPERSA_07468 [Pseudocohnilembus persalinus]